MKKIVLVLLVLLIAGTSVFAAGNKEAAGEEKIVIAGIVFQEDQFFRVIQKGMKDAAEELGVELMISNSQNKPDKESELVRTYIARGVNAIVISPLSDTSSVPALKEANDNGIKIVTYISPLGADFPVSYINSSQSELGSATGKVAREYIVNELGGKAKVATLAFKSLLPEISDMRVNSFLSEITDLPGVEVVAQQDAWLAEAAVAKSSDIITANPDLDLIYAANDGGTIGSVMGVNNAGKAGEIVVFGIDASEQLANFVLADDGILQASTGQQPYMIGYMAVEFAVKAIRGESVESTVIVPGVVIDRRDPAAVEAFKKSWAELIN
ncbi:MAG: substrate-binding domain-containing protein [Spirochaetales bacterium]|nr:substrate-binding domain-containing protein [Spirochaetales bacterium]